MPIGRVLNTITNQTIRMVGRVSLGGKTFRIRIANASGAQPVTIASAHAALRTKDAAIDPASDHTILFNGKPSVTLPQGIELVSDPFDFNVPNLARFAVSFFVSSDSGPTSHTSSASHIVTYVAKDPGDFTTAPDFESPTFPPGYYWLSGIDVVAPANAGVIMAMGDSITDATGSPFEDQDWPSLLAARLQGDKRTRNFAVANVGISGNNILRDGMGAAGLARFERHVLSQSNVRWLVLHEGTNDLGRLTDANQLTQAYHQIIEKAHAHGIGVVGTTIMPASRREETEKVRLAINDWIRTSGEFDAVADFDAAIKDPAAPDKMQADMHRGDWLHPNPKGYAAMANSVDLSIFLKPPKL